MGRIHCGSVTAGIFHHSTHRQLLVQSSLVPDPGFRNVTDNDIPAETGNASDRNSHIAAQHLEHAHDNPGLLFRLLFLYTLQRALLHFTYAVYRLFRIRSGHIIQIFEIQFRSRIHIIGGAAADFRNQSDSGICSRDGSHDGSTRNKDETGSRTTMNELNPIIHSQLRLSILSILMSVEEADFMYLKQRTGATMGNLSTQITRLEEAGYISVTKTFKGKRPRTVCMMTEPGKAAFIEYVRALQEYIAPASAATPPKQHENHTDPEPTPGLLPC